jgi:hypothetical protein
MEQIVTSYFLAIPVTFVVVGIGCALLLNEEKLKFQSLEPPKFISINDREYDTVKKNSPQEESETLTLSHDELGNSIPFTNSEFDNEKESGTESMAGSYIILQPGDSILMMEQNHLNTSELKSKSPQNMISYFTPAEAEFRNLSERERTLLSQRRRFKLAFLEAERKELLEKLRQKPFELASSLSAIRKKKLQVLEQERLHSIMENKLVQSEIVAKKESTLFERAKRVQFKVEQAKFEKMKLKDPELNGVVNK